MAQFSLRLKHTSILVGPNNSGKSTIVAALRVLAAAMVTARAKKPVRLPTPRDWARGYRIPNDSIPVSLENVLTDYEGNEATVEFRFSNRNRLTLIFPAEGGCFLWPGVDGRPVASTKDFKREYPFDIVAVPVLGPVESDEPMFEATTVQRNLATHRASRNFRNYWWHFGQGFDEFADLVASTWPGMTVESPKVEMTEDGPRVVMWCHELGGPPRELFWMGIGFQVWCQLLTHVFRAGWSQLIVIDEPEIYLHPNVQRQLLALLRSAEPDVLLATHSSEIVADADPTELVTVDKALRSGRRLLGAADVSLVLRDLGSAQNIVLTQVARTRRLFFVEGEDFAMLAAFARVLGLDRLATGADFALFPYGGFPDRSALTAIIRGIKEALGVQVLLGGVFDSDYRGGAEVAAAKQALSEQMAFAHIWSCKEIENYLLVPDVLARAASAAMAERARRVGGVAQELSTSVHELLKEVTDEMRADVLGQLAGKRGEFERHSGVDSAKTTAAVARELDAVWGDLEARLRVVPGKLVLSRLNSRLQAEAKVALTWRKVITAMRKRDVPTEVREVLNLVEEFRTAAPPGET